jgi:hypothetical protein
MICASVVSLAMVLMKAQVTEVNEKLVDDAGLLSQVSRLPC